jgi:Lrp/AsnC family leucine-responsive transcriptional regulator
MIDETDRHILSLLQEDARLSNAAVAEQVGLTTSTVFERIKKLEKKGVIKQYVAIVDPALIDQPITAFIRLVVGASDSDDYVAAKKRFVAHCLDEPQVLECHSVAGEDCYVLKVRVCTTQDLENLLERLRTSAPVTKSTSSIVMSTFKEETKLPL